MTLVSLTLPSDGQTAAVSTVNTPFNQLANVVNGNIDSTNISSLSGSKIQAGTLPSTALDTAALSGWYATGQLPNSITYNGNRSYTAVFNSVNLTSTLSPGTRVRLTRSTPAPTQCTNLSGSSQYYSKSSSTGFSFTDNFTIMAWIQPSSFATGGILSKLTAAAGFYLYMNSTGQIVCGGRSASVDRAVTSYQSVSTNSGWVHVAATLSMSTNTGVIYIDGVQVPSVMSGAATALTQAGNLEVGSTTAANFFPGKIAQAAVFSSVLSAATIRSYMSQTLSGTESGLISAYSFNNSLNDLNTTNANNLSANGGAVATNADSPFGNQADSSISSTLEYGIVQTSSFSTNTTVVIQVPKGCAIPTTGGLSAVAYSYQKAPYGMPIDRFRWLVESRLRAAQTIPIGGINTWFASNFAIAAPVGSWVISYHVTTDYRSTVAAVRQGSITVAPATPALPDDFGSPSYSGGSATDFILPTTRQKEISLAGATTYTAYVAIYSASGTETVILRGDMADCTIGLINAYL